MKYDWLNLIYNNIYIVFCKLFSSKIDKTYFNYIFIKSTLLFFISYKKYYYYNKKYIEEYFIYKDKYITKTNDKNKNL